MKIMGEKIMNKRLITMIIGLSLSTSMIGCTKQNSDTKTATSTTSDAAILSSINISSGESDTLGAAYTFIELGSTITVNGKYKNGITSKDDLKIESGNITINAKEDGVLGKDSVVITNGNITINSGGGSKNVSVRQEEMMRPGMGNQPDMRKAPSSGSSDAKTSNITRSNDTTVHIENEAVENILTFAPSNESFHQFPNYIIYVF